jgi:hypothetical protein
MSALGDDASGEVARLSTGNILIRRADSPACLTEACHHLAKDFFCAHSLAKLSALIFGVLHLHSS